MHSSLLLETGAPPTVAQAQLRHADPHITLGIYGHIIGESQRIAAEKVCDQMRPEKTCKFSGCSRKLG
jgi:integrase